MITKKDGVERLQGVPMFTELSRRDLGRVWDSMRIVEHAPGHRIVTVDRPGQGFHLILSGKATVERKKQRIDLGPGDFFGEMALIDDGPRSATVTAASTVVTASISAWEFKAMAKEHSELLWKLLVHLTSRLRAEQSVVDSLTS
jgi:CRP/FNR family transcriptional regulator